MRYKKYNLIICFLVIIVSFSIFVESEGVIPGTEETVTADVLIEAGETTTSDADEISMQDVLSSPEQATETLRQDPVSTLNRLGYPGLQQAAGFDNLDIKVDGGKAYIPNPPGSPLVLDSTSTSTSIKGIIANENGGFRLIFDSDAGVSQIEFKGNEDSPITFDGQGNIVIGADTDNPTVINPQDIGANTIGVDDKNRVLIAKGDTIFRLSPGSTIGENNVIIGDTNIDFPEGTIAEIASGNLDNILNGGYTGSWSGLKSSGSTVEVKGDSYLIEGSFSYNTRNELGVVVVLEVKVEEGQEPSESIVLVGDDTTLLTTDTNYIQIRDQEVNAKGEVSYTVINQEENSVVSLTQHNAVIKNSDIQTQSTLSLDSDGELTLTDNTPSLLKSLRKQDITTDVKLFTVNIEAPGTKVSGDIGIEYTERMFASALFRPDLELQVSSFLNENDENENTELLNIQLAQNDFDSEITLNSNNLQVEDKESSYDIAIVSRYSELGTDENGVDYIDVPITLSMGSLIQEIRDQISGVSLALASTMGVSLEVSEFQDMEAGSTRIYTDGSFVSTLALSDTVSGPITDNIKGKEGGFLKSLMPEPSPRLQSDMSRMGSSMLSIYPWDVRGTISTLTPSLREELGKETNSGFGDITNIELTASPTTNNNVQITMTIKDENGNQVTSSSTELEMQERMYDTMLAQREELLTTSDNVQNLHHQE